MATIIRRKRASRTSIGSYKRHELLTGEIRYPVLGCSGYGDMSGTDLTAFITDEMRADWEANRDELVAFIRRVHDRRRLPGFGTVALRARQHRHVAMGGAASGIAPCRSRSAMTSLPS
jgi:hypothetical protein